MAEYDKGVISTWKIYPKQVFLIIGNEFCERFTFYGIKTILILYFTTKLSLDKSVATALYHSFNVICYFSPIGGGILADGYIGKYRTILGMSILYGIGNIVLALTAIPSLGAPEIPGPMIGLLIIGIATGGIKPNISAFGGDQFTSKNMHLRHSFFSMFYFAINLGALFSTFFTPMIRAKISCFGETTCYSLAFGVPAMLMVISVIFFLIGTPWYIRNPPIGNVVGEFFHCIFHSIRMKISTPRKLRTKEHWLQYADDKYSLNTIDEFRTTLKVLLVFLPISIFWCLIDQQGSTWTLQAEEMNGQLGSIVVEPDQMQVLNPIFILALIPFYDFIVYPLATRCGIPNKPLQRIAVGMLLTVLSYVIAGFVQISIDTHAIKFPNIGESSFVFSNLGNAQCDLNISYYAHKNDLQQLPAIEYGKQSLHKTVPFGYYNVKVSPSGPLCTLQNQSFSMELNSKQSYLIILHKSKSSSHQLVSTKLYTSSAKTKKGTVKLRFINFLPNQNKTLFLVVHGGPKTMTRKLPRSYSATNYTVMHPKYSYTVTIKEQTKTGNVTVYKKKLQRLINGAVYSEVLVRNGEKINLQRTVDVSSNTVSVFLQIPQYFLIESAEILISITGLSFAYSQAPISMKSVVMAGWFITVGLGDLIVVIWAVIEEANKKNGQKPEDPAFKFFMFSGIMFIGFLIFILIAYSYTYVDDKRFTVTEDDDETEATALLDQ